MSRHRPRISRVALLTTLAAFVPVSAFALTGNPAPAPSAGMSVGASLGGCGVAKTQIYCSIDVSFSGVPGADYYTASVTRPDGSVQGFGQVGQGAGGGGTSVYVPYVGAGTYTVQVAAYGTPPGESNDHPQLLDSESADTPRGDFQAVPDADDRSPATGTQTIRPGQTGPGASPEADSPGGPPADPTPAEPANPEPQAPSQEPPGGETTNASPPPPAPAAPAPTQTLPVCQASESRSSDTENPSAAASTECATPSQDAQGSCCPPGG